MNKLFFLLIGPAVVTLTLGCRGTDDVKPRQKPQPEQPTVADLSNKSTSEVLKLKYSQAQLTCALWTQRGQSLNLSSAPNDTFTLDLKGDLKLPQTFKLSGQTQDHKVEAQIEVISLSHTGKLHHIDAAGNEYFVEYSPHAELNFSYTSATKFGDGQGVNGSGRKLGQQVLERITSILLKESYDLIPFELQPGVVIQQGSIHSYVECLMNTEMNPGYENQFEVQSKHP